jgi:hypothetical protein
MFTDDLDAEVDRLIGLGATADGASRVKSTGANGS